MKLRLVDGLPFASLRVGYGRLSVDLPNALVDTGSAGTVLSADVLARVGVKPEPGDEIRRIRGVGGAEFVFTRKIDRIEAGELAAEGFIAEVGGLMYGFDLDAIIGCDFLRRVGAVVDLGRMEIRSGQ